MIKLKKYTKIEVSDNYLNWLNDSEVTKFTDQKNKKNNISNIKIFLISNILNKKNYLFKILSHNIHIGNIKLGPVNFKNKSAYI